MPNATLLDPVVEPRVDTTTDGRSADATRRTAAAARQAVPLAIALLLALAGAASAQFPQYQTPGSVGQPPVDFEEQLETAVEEARWDLGGFRLDPWIGLRDVSYVDNVFADSGETTSDLTVTAGAGLYGYLPVGTDVVFSLYALPEYTWWQDQDDRSRLNGRYGAGLFAFRNRFVFQARAQRNETQRFVTPEVQQLTNQRSDEALLGLDFQLYRSLWVFASGQYVEYENLDADEDIPGLGPYQRLDREEEILRAGLQLKLAGERVTIGLGVEDSTVEFAEGALAEDNSGTSPLFVFEYAGPWFGSSIDLVARELEPINDSLFVPLDETTGRIAFFSTRDSPLSGSIYGFRNLVYSLSNLTSYALDERIGVSVGFRFSRLVGLSAFGEEGDLEYQAFVGDTLERTDEVSAYGASMDFGLGLFGLSFIATQERYDSNLPGFDRDITRYGFQLSLDTGPIGWP